MLRIYYCDFGVGCGISYFPKSYLEQESYDSFSFHLEFEGSTVGSVAQADKTGDR